MGARNDTRQRMVKAGAQLLASNGYAATGMLDVVEAAGASRGSIYFHFPDGKPQLVAESLALSTGRALERAARAVADSASTGEAVTRTGEHLAAVLEATGYQLGCPVATVALEVASTDAGLRDTCQDFFDRWRALYTERLLLDGVDRAAADQLATMIISVIEGGLLLSRTAHSTAPLLDACRAAARLLHHATPATGDDR
ncbi:TetR/AcrR family transcriptional regulator [Aquihabitans sp. McL0605]|uniref:TetR/AcrR family transcriptional regulator n=1 Tax=Aquihabitans sp. McL0605 TaxID=3415671 RepID=UPI003CF72614